MKLIAAIVCTSSLLYGAASGGSPVAVTINAPEKSPIAAIPSDFVGLSFGMKALLPDREGTHFFSPTNAPLVTLFRNVGVRHLRLGGTTVESPPATPIPGKAEIDDLFAFARIAGVEKIIYSLRLLETNSALNYAATNAAIARYIWDRYQSQLDSFALGNEPDLGRVFKQDWCITNFTSYLAKWRTFAIAITNAVPRARFAGPDGGSGQVEWTIKFARAQKNFSAVIAEHFYVGGAGRDVSPSQGIEAILSPRWITANETLYRKVAVPVFAEGLPLRFTEANDHYSGGVPDASNAFAGALWALDFLHWWAAHGASGVNFHNTQWVVNDVITRDSDGRLAITPKGYAFKAFELGFHGSVEPLTISNPEEVNFTAYAVRGAKQHFVTLINKEHSGVAREASVTINAPGISREAEVIYLMSPHGDVTAKTGVTLGGAAINNDGAWRGEWTSLKSDTRGQCALKVPPATAVIVKIRSD
jgi:hypothetical protein